MNGAVVFTLSAAFGAALLAVWLDARFPSLAPRGLMGRLVAAGAAWLLADGASRHFVRVLDTAPVEPRAAAGARPAGPQSVAPGGSPRGRANAAPPRLPLPSVHFPTFPRGGAHPRGGPTCSGAN